MNLLVELTAAIEAITPVDEREANSIERTLDRLTWPGDVFAEERDAHHVTASAFVVSARGVVLHLHRRLGIWVQPGGHVDSGETPELAALRETREETGLTARHLVAPRLFHVDVHPGPRGHTHYDLRYLVVAPPNDPAPAPGESSEVYWFAFPAALERCEPTLALALEKLEHETAQWDVRDWPSE